MRFGVCAPVASAGVLKSAGWDFVEEGVARFLQPELADGEWMGAELARTAARDALPIEAANLLVPAKLKITGPSADLGALRNHMRIVTERAQQAGLKTLVFGSGGARNVEAGFDQERAKSQILDFVKMAAEEAEKHDVVIVVEHLRRGECNMINSVAEAMEYVTATGHPNLECLVDSYHFWEENEPLETLAKAMGHIRHVHVADRSSRRAPGQTSGELSAEYVEFFRVLKRGGYDGRVSVEANWKPELEKDARVVLERLKRAWAEA